jgi:hypothetical protein
MAAPSLDNPAQRATTYVVSTLKVGPAHAKGALTFKLGCWTFFLTGSMVPATGGGTLLAGGCVDINGQPIRGL